MSKTTETKPQLRPYQEEGVKFLQSRKRAYLADEMGLGKSAQLIQASVGKTLVIAPATLVDSKTWENEVNKWADDPSRFTITAYSRIPSWQNRKMSTVPKDEFLRTWDTVIVDEAHYLKNIDAKRTRACLRVLKPARRVYLASGSPIPNWASEIFVPLRILNPLEATPGGKLGSYWRWVEKWFRVTPSPFANSAMDVGKMKGCDKSCDKRNLDDPCEHYQRFVRENLGGQFLRRVRDEVLSDLPPMQQQEVEVTMTPKQWKEYRSMKNTYVSQLDDNERVAWSTAAQHTNLDLITTGLGLLESTPSPNESGKLDRLREDLAERTRPTIVVAHYRVSVEAAAQVARELGKTVRVIHGQVPGTKRAEIVEEFQKGTVDVLVGSYDTIAEGLTLTAADTMILLEKSYKAARNEQVIRRIHRIGQTEACLVLDYIATGPKGQTTLDGNKRKLLADKKRSQEFTLTGSTLKRML